MTIYPPCENCGQSDFTNNEEHICEECLWGEISDIFKPIIKLMALKEVV